MKGKLACENENSMTQVYLPRGVKQFETEGNDKP